MRNFRLVPLYETITDLNDFAQAEVVRRRRYGVIEIVDGRLARIVFRPFPKWVSLWESLYWGEWRHQRKPGDRCYLYFNQPAQCPNYLALKYAHSHRDTRLRSFFAALRVLDQIAEIKRTDAIVADAANLRISDRLLSRLGWEKHTNSRWHRNYIKRFYGEYGKPVSCPDWLPREECGSYGRLRSANV